MLSHNFSIRCMLLFILVTTFYITDTQSISKITLQPMSVIYVVDTATTTNDISLKMEKSYGILFSVIGRHQLNFGKIMAIYHTSSAPWIFDVAIEVDNAASQQPAGIQFKTTDGGDAIVLHYKGPYEQISRAYEQIDEWLKKNYKQRSGAPIEARKIFIVLAVPILIPPVYIQSIWFKTYRFSVMIDEEKENKFIRHFPQIFKM